MKKLLLTLFAMLTLCCTAKANTTPIDFIYIHGADQRNIEEFDMWMHRMHPDMKKNLSKSPFIQEKLLKDAYITDTPEMLYWSSKANQSRVAVIRGLEISKKWSPKLTQASRSLIAYMLHDAVWLKIPANINPILDDLNAKVVSNYKKGEKTILVGYSAGSLISYQYMLNKSRFLNPAKFAPLYQKELNLSKSDINFVKQHLNQDTCIDAVIASKIGVLSADGGFILNPNLQQRRKQALKLKEQTELSCAPSGAVLGVINLGSPLAVFYSNLADDKSQLQYFTRKMLVNLVQSGQFFMTVNYMKDPIAVPIQNFTFKQLQQYSNISSADGFIYHTFVSGGTNTVAGHFRYWQFTNHYTKAVAKSYEKGYKLFYGE